MITGMRMHGGLPVAAVCKAWAGLGTAASSSQLTTMGRPGASMHDM